MQGFSIVIPVFNEAAILNASITDLHQGLIRNRYSSFEIILAENGSLDQTVSVAANLSRRFRRIRVVSTPGPNFGDAFKNGVQKAKYPYVVLFNADWWSLAFLGRSLELLPIYAIVVGSKRMVAAYDHRPLLRRLGTMLLALVLRRWFHYRGTDTHGIKAFRREALLALLPLCVTHEIIESELLLRATRAGLSVKEIPAPIRELRPPRLGFLHRCFIVTKELLWLYGQIRT